jgi:hypothetical protein
MRIVTKQLIWLLHYPAEFENPASILINHATNLSTEDSMAKKQAANEDARKFQDAAHRSWLMETDGKRVKAGDTAGKIMAGECDTLEVKELLYGDPWNTWRILITPDNALHLLKTSRELR